MSSALGGEPKSRLLTTFIGRTSLTPLALEGTMTIDCCWCLPAEVSLLPMTKWTALRGSPAPEIHHL